VIPKIWQVFPQKISNFTLGNIYIYIYIYNFHPPK
jgi:hypothetical protein